MKIKIHTRGVEFNSNTKEWLENKIISNFYRLLSVLQRVEMKLSDQNNTQGSRDFVCVLLIKGDKFEEIVIKDVESDFSVAINRVLERGQRTLSRRVQLLKSNSYPFN